METMQLWLCRLPPAQCPAGLEALLTVPERARLQCMRNGEQRQQRRLAWFLRNWVLARALGCAPDELMFSKNPQGKPQLQSPPADLAFNLSHAPGCVVLAVGGQPLGVDVEPLDRRADWQRIGRRMFSAAEQGQLAMLASPQRERAALCLWSAKEAWGKADGRGVSGFAEAPEFVRGEKSWQLPQDGAFWQYLLAGHVLSLASASDRVCPAAVLREITAIDQVAGQWGCQFNILDTCDENQ